MSKKPLFATESLVQQRMPKINLVKQLFDSFFPVLVLFFVLCYFIKYDLAKKQVNDIQQSQGQGSGSCKEIWGFMLSQVSSPVMCVQTTNKKKILEAFTTTEYSETVWRWRDTIYVHQNASLNHAYNQTTWALLLSELCNFLWVT